MSKNRKGGDDARSVLLTYTAQPSCICINSLKIRKKVAGEYEIKVQFTIDFNFVIKNTFLEYALPKG